VDSVVVPISYPNDLLREFNEDVIYQ